MCDRMGAIHEGRDGLNTEKVEMAAISNRMMKKAAAYALANLVADDKFGAQYILPHAFDPRVKDAIAAAVADAARRSGVARI
jgi:malic enzyme